MRLNKFHFSLLFISASLTQYSFADFADWYKKGQSANSQQEIQSDRVQPQPGQNQNQRLDQNQSNQQRQQINAQPINQYGQNTVRNSNIQAQQPSKNNDVGLEGRMNNLNGTIESINRLDKKFNNTANSTLASNYLNIVQLIVISETTKTLDGIDNRPLINDMLSQVANCQAKYKVNVIQQVNSQLPRDAAMVVQNYLSRNSISSSGNSCSY
ncbi:TPA: transporter [Acinetobacter baumannii]|nr:transporter [Acinetobacter baumannii]